MLETSFHNSRAYYANTIVGFLAADSPTILGYLSQYHNHQLEQLQKIAWLQEIELLKLQLSSISDGTIFLEFAIPRMGKRADCVLLIGSTVFVVEFKIGGVSSEAAAIEQVHDYALDLKNFHQGSHSLDIVPILIVTDSVKENSNFTFANDGVANPVMLNKSSLGRFVQTASSAVPRVGPSPQAWARSSYQPTPTIIQAAQALYEGHEVREITRSDASAKHLESTIDRIDSVIANAKQRGSKAICFITGVPGAGKTLAGLNIASLRARNHADENAVFLSGNGPLVDVLREALARDKAARCDSSKSEALREVRTFVQNIHHFRDEYFKNLNSPFEKVVIFDEAQRAWSKEQASKFMAAKWGASSFSMSEPDFLISVMDRHKDWCCIICLIGGGQEINTGEAGLYEWLSTLANKYQGWEVHCSDLLADRHYTVDSQARELLEGSKVVRHKELHLSVSVRSFRVEKLSSFVALVLDGNASAAAVTFQEIRERYPIVRTRDLAFARAWLRSKARGSERFGLVASSGAIRLRPVGVHIKAEVDPKCWFLNDRWDVRSSYYLEEVATEFTVQGLELDWVGVCWDADLRFADGTWSHHAFRGTRWQVVNSAERQRYLINSYRVLLTRARQGMVIFVPEGDDSDPTRPTSFYDATYEFLARCGIPEIESKEDTSAS